MRSRTVRAAKASRCDFESRRLFPEVLRRDYGVGEVSAAGDSVAVGEGDSSAFLVAAFFFGDSAGDAVSSAAAFSFFLAVVLFFVVAACVVVALVLVAVSSFFVIQEVTSATVVNVVIKNKMGFFIGLGLAAERMLTRTPDSKY
jgi:hypothetical protein